MCGRVRRFSSFHGLSRVWRRSESRDLPRLSVSLRRSFYSSITFQNVAQRTVCIKPKILKAVKRISSSQNFKQNLPTNRISNPSCDWNSEKQSAFWHHSAATTKSTFRLISEFCNRSVIQRWRLFRPLLNSCIGFLEKKIYGDDMISKTSLRNVHVIFRTDLNSLWVHSLIWFKKTILLSNMRRYLQRIGALIVRK